MLPTDLDTPRCPCSGELISHSFAGELSSFRIHGLDCFGNTRVQGGDSFQVLAVCTKEENESEEILGRVEDLGQGNYKAGYAATTAGSYLIEVTSKGRLAMLQTLKAAIWLKSHMMVGWLCCQHSRVLAEVKANGRLAMLPPQQAATLLKPLQTVSSSCNCWGFLR